MTLNRRNVLRGLGILPFVGNGIFDALGQQGEKHAPAKTRGSKVPPEYHLLVWLEGPFGVFLHPGGVAVWTPYFPEHQYWVEGTKLDKDRTQSYLFSFKESLVTQGPLQVDSAFKKFALQGVDPPQPNKAFKLRFDLPLPTALSIQSCRTVKIKGNAVEKEMPVNFLLLYKVKIDQFQDKNRLALCTDKIEIAPAVHSSRTHQFLIQAGVPTPGSYDDMHTKLVLSQLVYDVDKTDADLQVTDITSHKHTCPSFKTNKVFQGADVRVLGTDVDCTAGGLPGCNPPSLCG